MTRNPHTLEKAIAIALQAHAGQVEKSGQPYILHPLRVMSRLQTMEDRAVAVLHEILDQPGWTKERLKAEGIPSTAVTALELLKMRDEKDYLRAVHRCIHHPIALRVRIADLEDDLDLRRFSESDITEEDRKELEQRLEAYDSLIIPHSSSGYPLWFSKKQIERTMRELREREKLPIPMYWPED